MQEIKVTTRTEDDTKPFMKREQAQKLTFAQWQELLLRDVRRKVSRQYKDYTRDSIATYIKSPGNNIENIREVSRFLERNCTLYRKMIEYYATAPLFHYNLIQTDNDYSKSVDSSKMIKSFVQVAKDLHGFNIKKDMYTAIYNTIRDGMYVGYAYSDKEHTFLMPLDISFVRIFGKNPAGEFVCYFNASYFSGNNKIFVEGLDGDTSVCWDNVFVEGWNAYNQDKQNNQWFRLPPEKCFVMIAGPDDQFNFPLPLFLGLFRLLFQLQDKENILADKAELENYKLIVNKIPLISGSEDVDDFAVSLEVAERFGQLFDVEVPDLVGVVTSPGLDMDVVSFENANTSEDVDSLGQGINNLFNNAGMSQLVVAGGSSTNSVGLKFAIMNDLSNIWVYVNRIESWLNFFIKENLSKGYEIIIHRLTRYNEEEYVTQKKDLLSFGGSLMDYLTALGDTPFEAWNKLNFEKSMGFKSLLEVPETAYTKSSTDNEGGRPQSDDDDLSDEGMRTRDGDKNTGTKANK